MVEEGEDGFGFGVPEGSVGFVDGGDEVDEVVEEVFAEEGGGFLFGHLFEGVVAVEGGLGEGLEEGADVVLEGVVEQGEGGEGGEGDGEEGLFELFEGRGLGGCCLLIDMGRRRLD